MHGERPVFVKLSLQCGAKSCQQRCHGCAESRRCMIGVKRLTCVFPPRRHSHGTTRPTRPERQPPAPARRRPQLSCRAPRRCPRARLGPGALCGVRDDVAGDARRGPAGPAATGGLVASGPAPCGAGRLRVADAQHLPEPGTLPRPGGPHPGAGGRPAAARADRQPGGAGTTERPPLLSGAGRSRRARTRPRAPFQPPRTAAGRLRQAPARAVPGGDGQSLPGHRPGAPGRRRRGQRADPRACSSAAWAWASPTGGGRCSWRPPPPH